MNRLQKVIAVEDDRRKDNADKKQLFEKENHPHPASYHQEEWAFISDPTLRENISYQLQYLEFLVNLYNEYQVYLTVESLLCKTILSTVASIVEAALFDLIQVERAKRELGMIERTDFTALLGEAYHNLQLIDRETWHYFHELRKVRNYVHLKAADFREHVAYSVKETNEALDYLEKSRTAMQEMARSNLAIRQPNI